MEPGKVYPNPASWDRLNTALEYAGMKPSSSCGENYNPLFYSMCTGFIGTETTIAFVDFVKNHEFNYSTNPTYLSGSKIRVKTQASDLPVSYITTVGLYNDNNELLATAKLSEPLKKTSDTEFTIRVRLDY